MDIFGFAYAIIVAGGGVMGYIKAGSVISLLMGMLFGGLSACGAYLTSQDYNKFHLLLLTSGILTLIMGIRAVNSGKFMPAGLVAGLSLLMVVRLFPRLMAKS